MEYKNNAAEIIRNTIATAATVSGAENTTTVKNYWLKSTNFANKTIATAHFARVRSVAELLINYANATESRRAALDTAKKAVQSFVDYVNVSHLGGELTAAAAAAGNPISTVTERDIKNIVYRATGCRLDKRDPLARSRKLTITETAAAHVLQELCFCYLHGMRLSDVEAPEALTKKLAKDAERAAAAEAAAKTAAAAEIARKQAEKIAAAEAAKTAPKTEVVTAAEKYGNALDTLAKYGKPVDVDRAAEAYEAMDAAACA